MMNRSFLIVLILLPGCTRYRETDTRVIREPEWGHILVFMFDPRFGEEEWAGPAYEFLTGTTNNYFRGRSEPDDRVLFARLSDDDRSPVLWQGTRRSLFQDFRSADTLRQFIEKNATRKKHVYASIARMLDYTCDLPPVRVAKAKAVVVVLSDMMDQSPTKAEDIKKAAKALNRFLTLKTEMGYWWVDYRAKPDFDTWYREAGLPEVPFINQEWHVKPLTFE